MPNPACHPLRIVAALTLLGVSTALLARSDSPTTRPSTDFALPEALQLLEQTKDNAATPAKIALGRALFFETRLSRDGKVACATCHNPDKGFSIGERVASIGERKGMRNPPSLVNVGYSRSLFWDGRAASLEEQALVPIGDRCEMDMPLDLLVKRLNDDEKYREQFQAVFSDGPTAIRVAQALAAFERTLVSTDTPFDRYLRGDEKTMSEAALRGMQLFYGQGRCAICHKGSNLTDERFHNIGTADPELRDDPGRRAITGRAQDQSAFRTPQLREVAASAPYMHSGRFVTLRQVVEHYNFGGVTDARNDHRDDEMRVLYMSEEQVEDLVAFLAEGLSTPKAKPEDKP